MHVAGSIVHGATVVVSSGHGQTVVNVGMSVGNRVGVGVGLVVGTDAAGDSVQPAQVFKQFSRNRWWDSHKPTANPVLQKVWSSVFSYSEDLPPHSRRVGATVGLSNAMKGVGGGAHP